VDGTEVAAALVQWAKDTCPELKGAYDFDPPAKTQPLPDVAASVASEEVRRNAPELGLAVTDLGLEQADVHVVHATMLLMVPPDPPEVAAELLQSMFNALRLSVAADDTLGGRVPAASTYLSVSYDPPYVEFDDGTKGRAAFVSIAVAELT
jgi:hypothetical protein